MQLQPQRNEAHKGLTSDDSTDMVQYVSKKRNVKIENQLDPIKEQINKVKQKLNGLHTKRIDKSFDATFNK